MIDHTVDRSDTMYQLICLQSKIIIIDFQWFFFITEESLNKKTRVLLHYRLICKSNYTYLRLGHIYKEVSRIKTRIEKSYEEWGSVWFLLVLDEIELNNFDCTFIANILLKADASPRVHQNINVRKKIIFHGQFYNL